MKLGIVGTREFKNWDCFMSLIDSCCIDWSSVSEMVLAGSGGANAFAGRLAKMMGKSCTIHYANWNLGFNANHERNRQIVAQSDTLIALLIDGCPCKATRDCIDQAVKAGIKVVQLTASQEDALSEANIRTSQYKDRGK